MTTLLSKTLENALENDTTICVNINIDDVSTTRITCDPTEISFNNDELVIESGNFEYNLDCSSLSLEGEEDEFVFSGDKVVCYIDFIY